VIKTLPSSGVVVESPEIFSGYPELTSAVSTRKGGLSPEPYGMNLSFKVGDVSSNVLANRELFFGSLNITLDRLAIPHQVHGNTVRFAEAAGEFESCDGLVTDAAGICLVISVADCLPILMFDPVSRSIAAVHAGWRGSQSGIVSKAIELWIQKVGIQAKNLIAYIGPGAGVCCYEVGEEVAGAFADRFIARAPGKKPHLDVKQMNRELLLEAGVLVHNIEVSGHCTICHPEIFHSYRREGQQSGRMMAVLGLK
jgi:YfiH family protein